VEVALRDAISLGADDTILLSDRAFAGADTLATAYALAAGIKKIGDADVILMGKQAIDGDTGQVGPGVAECLKIPHITDIKKIEEIATDSRKVTVERLLEDGYVRLRTSLPVVLTVVKEINVPRLPSLKGKMRAKSAKITVWTAKDLEIDLERVGLNGSPTQVMRIFTPPKPQGGKIYKGDIKDNVSQLLAELRAAGLTIGRGGEK
jgi:electron transfer flavoprotein beta subunit